MDERLLSAVSLVFFLFVSLLERRTALALPTDNGNVQADQGSNSPIVKRLHENFTVAENGSVVMTCNIENVEGWAIMWYHPNGTVLCIDDDPPSKTSDFESFKCQKENHSIKVSNISESRNNTGVYFCMASDEFRTTHTVQLKVSVEIEHVPKMMVDIGENLILSCKVHGSPKTKVQWLRKRSSASASGSSSSASAELIGTTAEMTIQNVNVSDSGNYTCWASDGDSEASELISITVVSGLSAEHEYVYPETQTTSMCCIYRKSKNGSQNTLRWLKNGDDLSTLPPRYERVAHGKHKSCLSIKKVNDTDLGIYTCKTEKSNGAVEKATIKLTGTPQTPVLIEVTSDGLNSKSKIPVPVLKWKIKTFAPLTSYEIHVRRQENVDWTRYTQQQLLSAEKEEVIEQKFVELPNGQYAVKLTVSNKYGSSELITPDTPLVVDVPETTTTPIDDAGHGHGAAGGNHASVGLLVATTILMTLLLCR